MGRITFSGVESRSAAHRDVWGARKMILRCLHWHGVNRRVWWLGVSLGFCVVLSVPAVAGSLRWAGLDALVRDSDYVIYGRVVATRCVWDSATRTIWTQTDFQVLDGPKGNPKSTITVTEPGGVIGEVGHLFPGVPRFAETQEWVVFLYRASGDRLRVTGLSQGAYDVATDPVSAEKTVQLAVPQQLSVVESSAPPSKQNLPKMVTSRLRDFLGLVRQKVGSR